MASALAVQLRLGVVHFLRNASPTHPLMNSTVRLLSSVALAGLAFAQDPVLVTAAGAPLPLSTLGFPIEPPILYTVPLASSPTGHVYASLDASLPTGRYLFDVADVYLHSISQLPPEDRVFLVVNNGDGTFTLQRESATPGLPAVGVGAAGGDSIPVFPFSSPLPVAGRPDMLCVQKVLMYRLEPGGSQTYLGFRHFRVGDGQPGSVSGFAFQDLDRDGVRDAGEDGIAGATVKLVDDEGAVVATRTTDAAGAYLFAGVSPDDLSVVLELDTGRYTATTPLDVRLSNCGCGPQTVDFGAYSLHNHCCRAARTPGFWRNCHGIWIIQCRGFWDELRALNLVDACGRSFNPANGAVWQWRSYMQGGNATNMAYMLSIHLAAMQLNVLSGKVSRGCWVSTPHGPTTIGAVMDAANASLGLFPLTRSGHPQRAAQAALKNVLDAANNNRNWL
jgi:hypothetical protein